ncbi:MAG: methionine synthase I [Acidiferrobacteraceae bacterium]|jgi:5-methyltetrahydrofolate--homocysteine methyltransferase|nr:methionine synthase I [Acidiferrobacteraceae bacterium]MDP6398518.1 betaine--homocysteine S-methyltransferase [Arenicellales bacterium]MDP6552755.1 betaine--homocysteine S-methyltransferase [Arenicellales bacterium]MDP6791099.1 betaine--homocysteine S-methyltransferase [Arenicellales bacterium]MDP6918901.1 betaine--homocysteine S-methyltransferase [Arenicellales bacterium]|tara:strand:- start:5537 stop:6574 length:1038 start_codon:yes stop_codon:yes gene_type:complete
MANNRFEQLLLEREWLLADGATGTNYFSMGLQSGDAPELWNVDHPDRVTLLHQQFIDAGADILLTNSFGGSAYRLKLHQSEHRVPELNAAAARLARTCADASGRPIVAAGSMGPTGEILEPVGTLTFEEAKSAFAEQAEALADGGADVIWLETMSSKEELQAAGAGAAECGLPVVATMTFDTNGSTMMGVPPARLVDIYRETVPRLAAYGANCGVGAADLVGTLLAMRSHAEDVDILVAKANCGIPQFVDGEIQYSGTPELMAEYACLARDCGARIIGGCCGTTPVHLAAMYQALLDHSIRQIPDIDEVAAALGPVTAGTRDACLHPHAPPAEKRRSRGGGRRRA